MFADVVAEVDGLDDAAWVAGLKQIEAEQRQLDARRAAMLAVGERRKAYRRDGHASMWGLLRASLGWSNAECRDRTQLARLIEAYREVGESLYETWISVANAAAIARGFANPRCGDQVGDVLGTLLTNAQRMEYDDFRHVVRRWELLADADGAHRDREQIHENRDAHFTEWQGQGTLLAQWGDIDTAINKQVFERFVQAEWDADWKWTVDTYGEAEACKALMPRTEAQRRADAASAILRRAGSIDRGVKAPRTVVNIHLDYQSFSDLMAVHGLFPERHVDPFEQGGLLATQLRCETADGDLIDPHAVLQAALEGYVRFVVLNDEGIPIRWGRQRRLFEGAARDAVMMLSNRCTHPGCRVAATHSEADHLTPWSQLGETEPANGGPRCRKHNRFRNVGYASHRDRYGGWHTYRPDGTEIR